MGQPRRILVACGTAITTSREVARALEEALKERGVEVVTKACKASEIPRLVAEADLVLTTTAVSGHPVVPVIQTVAFLTGIGRETAIQQIIKALEE